jgi:predicted trehalose synthase
VKTLLRVLLFVLAAITAMAVEKPAPAPTPKPPVKKKVYELPKTGLNQPRPAGGWINAEIVGTRLVIKFFDKLKKPVPPDVERGLVRFNYAAKNDKKAVLGREGNTLATPATVRPPHNFQVILSLFAGKGAEPTESYTFKYP